MANIFRIGITGPTGAGKGSVSAVLSSRYSIPVMDADKIYHSILENNSECKRELSENFGAQVIKEGKVDRKALGAAVFASGAEKKLLLLNAITHKYVIKETEELIREEVAKGSPFVIIDAPLLIEAGMHLSCNKVICVLADRKVREERIIKRDGITKEAASARISKQKTDEFYISASDIVIYNDKSLLELEEKVEEIARSLGIKESGIEKGVLGE